MSYYFQQAEISSGAPRSIGEPTKAIIASSILPVLAAVVAEIALAVLGSCRTSYLVCGKFVRGIFDIASRSVDIVLRYSPVDDKD
ncbi:hypothetical protein CPC08DRAFT_705187 [Agrocybe pediades]|nr:hypothetical protein CPC08DRAFT_705187 [Agrocybe pediades]